MRRALSTDTGPVWVITFVVLAGLPLTGFVYYPAVLRTGQLAPTGDTILIPMMECVFRAVAAAPILIALTWACLVTYDPGRPFLGWRTDRLPISLLVSACFFVPASFITLSIVRTPFSEFAAQEWLWLPHRAACLAWCLLLRSAALCGPDPSPAKVR